MLSCSFSIEKELDLEGEWRDCLDKLVRVSTSWYVILKSPPILEEETWNVSDDSPIYEYRMTGIVIDSYLGIWIDKIEMAKGGMYKGNFNGTMVVARSSFVPRKHIMHVFPGRIFDDRIAGNMTDLVPGVMGPLISKDLIRLRIKDNWKAAITDPTLIYMYAEDAKEVKEVQMDTPFFVIGPRLYTIRAKAAECIPTTLQSLDLHMEYAFYVHKCCPMKWMISRGYIHTRIDMSSLFKPGETGKWPRRIIAHDNKMS